MVTCLKLFKALFFIAILAEFTLSVTYKPG